MLNAPNPLRILVPTGKHDRGARVADHRLRRAPSNWLRY